MVFALCSGTGMEKTGIIYKSLTSFFAADRTVRHHDTFTDVVVSLFVAVLFDAAAYLHRNLWKFRIVNIDGKEREARWGGEYKCFLMHLLHFGVSEEN